MFSPIGIVAFLIVTAAALYVLWRFWARNIKSARGPRALAGACLLFLFSLFPAALLLQAFLTGEAPCLGRRCSRTYSVDDQPLFFWANMSILYALFLVVFVAALHIFYRNIRGGWRS